MNEHTVLCVIPARGGSKGVLRKNLRLLAGKPLLAHSIEQALAASSVHRTIVSTDDEEIAEVARRHGAEVPCLRPAAIAGDLSTDLEVFVHMLAWLREHEDYKPDMCLHLRPTYPVRDVRDIDRMVAILATDPAIDSVRSVVPAAETPFKMWFRSQEGMLTPVVATAIGEPYNQPRQQLPEAFFQNAAIDVVRTRVITDMNSMSGQVIYGYVMDTNFDIDTEADLLAAEKRIAGVGLQNHERRVR